MLKHRLDQYVVFSAYFQLLLFQYKIKELRKYISEVFLDVVWIMLNNIKD